MISKFVLYYEPKTVLDVGCGTGFQSYLYSTAGCGVIGVDVSENMIKSARSKLRFNGSLERSNLVLFPEQYHFVKYYNDLINLLIKKKQRSCNKPEFLLSNFYELPFQSNSFDHVNCCGSVLNLIDDYHLGLDELSRLVKPRGTIFIEAESRWTMDRFWTFVDCILGNKIGFNSSFRDSLRNIFSNPFRNIDINYQYGEKDRPIPIKLNLLTNSQLKKYFSSHNLKVLRHWTIHSLTNFLPSITLDTDYPSIKLIKTFGILSSIEERMPLQLPGCSNAYLLKREL